MQKTNNEFVETVLMAIPADMLEEVGIGPCSTVQMHVSRGRIHNMIQSRLDLTTTTVLHVFVFCRNDVSMQ